MTTMRSLLLVVSVVGVAFCQSCALGQRSGPASTADVGSDDLQLWRWMGDMMDTIGNRTLNQIMVPGTHDSGAIAGTVTGQLQPGGDDEETEDLIKFAEKLGIPVQDVIVPWAQSQDRNFLQSLSDGIRYIDLRAGWNGTAWTTFHMQVAAFMTNSTTEVVIVETATTNDAVTGGDTGTLVAMIEEELGNWMYPRAGGFNDTISSMVAMDKRLVVSIDNETAIAEHPAFWLGSDTILNSYANQCNLTLVEQFNDDRVAEYQSYRTNPSLNGKLYKISWTRTPNFDCILAGFLGGPNSLIEVADVANKDLQRWADEKYAAKLPLANIMIIDHYETSPIVAVVARNNAAFPPPV